MSARYTWVNWNRHKRVYDALMVLAVVAYLVVFVAVGQVSAPAGRAVGIEVSVIRAFGTCSLVLLHVVLAIGPLARLDRRFAPLLYNRRHLGVMTFLLGFVHFVLVVGYYGGFGVRNPILAVLAHHASYASVSDFPFELLGFVALVILFVMAATSHDFWLANLTARVWKAMHMLVYVAYTLLLGHVVFGVMQSEPSSVYPMMLLVGAGTLIVLHVVAGVREWGRDGVVSREDEDGWLDGGAVDAIPEGRAVSVCAGGGGGGGRKIALMRYEGKVSAVGAVCAHQGGPLDEGKVIDGCLTCPWHGYQYVPGNGQSPPPYEEKIPTYRVRIRAGRVLVDPEALPSGTPVEPALIPEGDDG